jgi:hypothetical protein
VWLVAGAVAEKPSSPQAIAAIVRKRNCRPAGAM